MCVVLKPIVPSGKTPLSFYSEFGKQSEANDLAHTQSLWNNIKIYHDIGTPRTVMVWLKYNPIASMTFTIALMGIPKKCLHFCVCVPSVMLCRRDINIRARSEQGRKKSALPHKKCGHNAVKFVHRIVVAAFMFVKVALGWENEINVWVDFCSEKMVWMYIQNSSILND